MLDEPEQQEPIAEEAEVVEDTSSLKAALEEEKGKAQQYLASWQRAQADFINYKRRVEEEREEGAKISAGLFILDLLPVLDDLERALMSVPPQLVALTWVDGVKLIYRKFLAILSSHDVEPIPALGEDFDPHFHKAVMQAEGEEGKVVAELQRGYKVRGRVLRPALVAVGQGPARAPEAPPEASSM
ncbi:MAG: nucleotide exchange factor GrpE [Chloroflexi bacterium]|nr:nucleotide exchange factor GrpE [Chloroflexota bacterium]